MWVCKRCITGSGKSGGHPNPMLRQKTLWGGGLHLSRTTTTGKWNCRRWKSPHLPVLSDAYRWTISDCLHAKDIEKSSATATPAEVRVKDLISHYGLPDQICSDNQTHFTRAVCAEVSRMLNITWSFHCPYHPQSSAQVERANSTLKEWLAKMQQEGTQWMDAMRIALCSMKASYIQQRRWTVPTSFVFGRCFSFPGSVDLRTADIHLTSDALMNYCIKLSETLQVTSNQVNEAWAEPPEGGHSLVPGKWVMIHKPQRLAWEAKYEKPYQIILVTPSTVHVAKKSKWIHANHCKLFDAPTWNYPR